MEYKKWKSVLIEWVNCLEFSKPISCLEDLKNGDFLKNFQKFTTKSETVLQNNLTYISNLIENYYPKYSIENKTDLTTKDLIGITSLLLHYSCIFDRRQILTVPVCKNLSQQTQTTIKNFLENVNCKITNDNLFELIHDCNYMDKNEQDVIKQPTTTTTTSQWFVVENPTSPLQNLLKTPISKHLQIEKKNHLIAKLETDLELEQTEKSNLIEELKNYKIKFKDTEKQLIQKINENKRLKDEILVLESSNNQEKTFKEQFEIQKCLKSEIKTLEIYTKKLEDEIEDKRNEKDSIKTKNEILNIEYNLLQKKFIELETNYENLLEQSKQQQLTIEQLDCDCNELKTLINEYKTPTTTLANDSSLLFESEHNIPIIEDLACSVVEVQLKEVQHLNEELIEQLNNSKDYGRRRDEENEKLVRNCQKLECDLSLAKKSVEKFQQELNESKNLLKEFDNKIVVLNNEKFDLNQQIVEIESKFTESLTQMTSQINNYTKETNKLKTELFKAQSDLESANNYSKEIQLNNEKLNEEIIEIRKSFKDLELKNLDTLNELTSKEELIKNLETDLQLKQETIIDKETQITDLEVKFEEIKLNKIEIEKLLKEQEIKNVNLNANYEEISQVLENCEIEKRNYLNQLINCQEINNNLKDEIREYSLKLLQEFSEIKMELNENRDLKQKLLSKYEIAQLELVRLQDTLIEVNKNCEQQKIEKDNLQGQCNNLKTQLLNTLLDLESATNYSKEIQLNNDNLKDEIVEIRKSFKDFELKNLDTLNELITKEELIRNLESDLQLKQETIIDKETEIMNLEIMFEEIKLIKTETEKLLKEQEIKNVSLNANYEEVSQVLENCKIDNRNYLNELISCQEINNNFKDEVREYSLKLLQELTEIKTELNESQNLKHKLSFEYENAQAELVSLQNTLNQINKNFEHEKHENYNLQEQCNNLKTIIENYNIKEEELLNKIQTFETESDELNKQIINLTNNLEIEQQQQNELKENFDLLNLNFNKQKSNYNLFEIELNYKYELLLKQSEENEMKLINELDLIRNENVELNSEKKILLSNKVEFEKKLFENQQEFNLLNQQLNDFDKINKNLQEDCNELNKQLELNSIEKVSVLKLIEEFIKSFTTQMDELEIKMVEIEQQNNNKLPILFKSLNKIAFNYQKQLTKAEENLHLTTQQLKEVEMNYNNLIIDFKNLENKLKNSKNNETNLIEQLQIKEQEIEGFKDNLSISNKMFEGKLINLSQELVINQEINEKLTIEVKSLNSQTLNYENQLKENQKILNDLTEHCKELEISKKNLEIKLNEFDLIFKEFELKEMKFHTEKNEIYEENLKLKSDLIKNELEFETKLKYCENLENSQEQLKDQLNEIQLKFDKEIELKLETRQKFLELENENKNLCDKCFRLETNNSNLQENYKKLKEMLEKHQLQEQDKNEEIKTLQDTLDDCKLVNLGMEETINVLNNKLEVLEGQLKNTSKENEEFKEKFEEIKTQLELTRKELEIKTKTFDDVTIALNNYKTIYEISKTSEEQLRVQLNEIQLKFDKEIKLETEMDKKFSKLEIQIENLCTKNELIKSELELKKNELEIKTKSCDELTIALNDCKIIYENSKTVEEKLKNQLSVIQENFNEELNRKIEINQKCLSLENDNKTLLDKCTDLEVTNCNLKQNYEKLETNLNEILNERKLQNETSNEQLKSLEDTIQDYGLTISGLKTVIETNLDNINCLRNEKLKLENEIDLFKEKRNELLNETKINELEMLNKIKLIENERNNLIVDLKEINKMLLLTNNSEEENVQEIIGNIKKQISEVLINQTNYKLKLEEIEKFNNQKLLKVENKENILTNNSNINNNNNNKEDELKKKLMSLKQKLLLTETSKNNLEKIIKQLRDDNKKLQQQEQQQKEETVNDDEKYKLLLKDYIELNEKNQDLININSKINYDNNSLKQLVEQLNLQLNELLLIKEAYDKLLEVNNKLMNDVDTLKYKRLRDKDEYMRLLKREKDLQFNDNKRIQDVRIEYEAKLEKMKDKMLKLYREEVGKELEKIKLGRNENDVLVKSLTKTKSELFEAEQKIQLLEMERDMLKTKQLQQQQQKQPQDLNKNIKQQSTNNNSKLLINRKIATLPPLRSTTTLNESSKSNATFLSRQNLQMEDEDDLFNDKYLLDLKEGKCNLNDLGRESVTSRMSQLAFRNSMVPQHLKSSYPAELQFISPNHFKEDDIKAGNIEHLDDSQSKLLPGDKPRKKDVGTTSYKKPGPPTPSKNGGRLSLQGNEVHPLRTLHDTKTPKGLTPNRIRALFTSSRSTKDSLDGQSTTTPITKRLNIFRRPR